MLKLYKCFCTQRCFATMTLELEWNTEQQDGNLILQQLCNSDIKKTHGSTIEKIQELDGWCVVV